MTSTRSVNMTAYAMMDSLAAPAAALAVAFWCATVDATFRSTLPPAYVAMFHPWNPAVTLGYMIRAAMEEVLFRGGMMAGLAMVFQRLGRGPALILAAVIAQAVCIAPNPAAHSLYGVLRFFLPGLVWSWVWWRHGLPAAIGAHAACHLMLDPMLGVTL